MHVISYFLFILFLVIIIQMQIFLVIHFYHNIRHLTIHYSMSCFGGGSVYDENERYIIRISLAMTDPKFAASNLYTIPC